MHTRTRLTATLVFPLALACAGADPITRSAEPDSIDLIHEMPNESGETDLAFVPLATEWRQLREQPERPRLIPRGIEHTFEHPALTVKVPTDDQARHEQLLDDCETGVLACPQGAPELFDEMLVTADALGGADLVMALWKLGLSCQFGESYLPYLLQRQEEQPDGSWIGEELGILVDRKLPATGTRCER